MPCGKGETVVVGANELIHFRDSHIFGIESNQYNHSLLSFAGNNHSSIRSINTEWLRWSGHCVRPTLVFVTGAFWKCNAPFIGVILMVEALGTLAAKLFWLLSSRINSMAMDSAYLKGWSHWHHVRKKSDGFDSMAKKRRKWLIGGELNSFRCRRCHFSDLGI